MLNSRSTFFLVGLRLSLGLLFLWAFLDKLFGFGFATLPEKSWLQGGSPTFGFLSHAKGPMSAFYQAIAGSSLTDWLFMLGLLCIGLSLCLGIAMKLATKAGALLVILMWSAGLPPANHPFLDDHIVYFFALLFLGTTDVGEHFGFARSWKKMKLVRKFRILE